MAWYEHIGCKPPDWETEAITIVVDYIMLLISSCCLMLTIYGTYRYLKDHKALQKTNSIKPSKPLYFGGLVFFVVSSITLVNAVIYDAAYLVCPRLDDIEGPIYHFVYFVQIFCLWLILFLRIHYIFKSSTFELSKFVVRFFILAFVLALTSIIPVYAIYQFHADSFVTLPFVVISAFFSTAILVTFVRKLLQIFLRLGIDELLLKTMVKNTILAIMSISCTFLVIAVLVVLYVKHNGFEERHSILEELILELFILIDIVSNFICVLLSYSFFDPLFMKVCGSVNRKIVEYTSKKISSSAGSRERRLERERRRDKTMSQTRTIGTIGTTNITHLTTNNDISMVILHDDYTDKMNTDVEDLGDDTIEKQMHEQSKTKPVASIILKLSNRKKKSNSPSSKLKNVKQNKNNDITVTLINDINDDTSDLETIYKPKLNNTNSMAVSIGKKVNKIPLRPTKSQPAPKKY